GTLVEDEETGKPVGELLRVGDQVLVARGGRGGRGNARFATSTHQAPREWDEGGEGGHRRLVFTLKLIADIGLVGAPNAGKSTLLSVISAARPKIADYPFTTLEPNLGVVGLSGSRSFVVADIPGIIEGAHAGKGLGTRFLQHVERTRLLAYLIPLDTEDAAASYAQLHREVALYSAALAAKPHVVVLTKSDLVPADADLPDPAASDALWVVAISSAAGQGIEDLKERFWSAVQQARALEADDDDDWHAEADGELDDQEGEPEQRDHGDDSASG
ncbi:MAG TPA: GTPase, partial [Gemmatimonadales bacterium]|nr:GTPase [Gemmatimonadales bacterium]